MAVTDKDVLHVAALARLGVATDRVPALAAELSAILGHMALLQSVDTQGVEPMAGPPGESRLTRSDEFGSDPLLRSREDLAPSSRDGFYLVPRLAAHEDHSA